MGKKKRGPEYLWPAEPDMYPCIDCGAPCARLHIRGKVVYLDPETKRMSRPKELRLALEHRCKKPRRRNKS